MTKDIQIMIIAAVICLLIILILFGAYKKYQNKKAEQQKKLDSFIKNEVKKSSSRTGKNSNVNIDKIIWEISDSIDLTTSQKNRIIRDLERLKGD